MTDIWIESLKQSLSFTNIGIAFLGTLSGIIVGALPGLGTPAGIALLIPFTFGLPPQTALILCGGMYVGSVYGGSITAIVLNTPGDPTSAATVLDGFPMARQGKGATALSASTMASFLGGIFGVFILMFFSPYIASMAIKFGSGEYFILAVFGLGVIALASKTAIIKGLISGFLGWTISTIGYDSISGFSRFSFGNIYLTDGIPFVPAVVGLFAISQALLLAEEGKSVSESVKLTGNVLEGIIEVFKHFRITLQSIGVGAFLGAVPGVGGTASNFLAYFIARQTSSSSKSFGEGNIEGVIAPEAANNATVGTSLIPTLVFGIPGSAGAAMFLGVLIIHGLSPGYKLFSSDSIITYTFFWGLLFANFMLPIICFPILKHLAKITTVSYIFLVPIIITLTMIGSFALRNSMYDVLIALLFGIIGYYLIKGGFSNVCFVLGLILGPIAEKNLARALIIYQGYHFLYQRPLVLIFLILTIILLIFPYFQSLISSKNKETNIEY